MHSFTITSWHMNLKVMGRGWENTCHYGREGTVTHHGLQLGMWEHLTDSGIISSIFYSTHQYLTYFGEKQVSPFGEFLVVRRLSMTLKAWTWHCGWAIYKTLTLGMFLLFEGSPLSMRSCSLKSSLPLVWARDGKWGFLPKVVQVEHAFPRVRIAGTRSIFHLQN